MFAKIQYARDSIKVQYLERTGIHSIKLLSLVYGTYKSHICEYCICSQRSLPDLFMLDLFMRLIQLLP